MVDFGCGTGRASAWLAAQGATVHGVDTSPEMINVATRLVPEAQFAVLEEADLPFESNSVDVVMSISVLQYVPQELGKLTEILREWRRVLRPEGLAIAVEQVNNGNLGRAAPSSHYVDSFAEAGLTTIMFKPIRLGHSRFVQLAERHPRVAGLPILPRLIIREAGSSRLDLSGSRYADFLFIARPVTRP